MRHLLLGDDTSVGADVAWLWTHAQRWAGWRLTVLRADPPPIGVAGTAEPRAVDAWRPLIDGPGFESVEFMVSAADPRAALSMAETDLVVVGAARSGIGPRFIGSTTEWLLHDPPAPVVLARRGRPVRTVMVCADGSDHAAAVAGTLASLPWASTLDLEVLAVDDGRTDPVAAIETMTALLQETGATIRSSIHRGRSPHREILHAAESSDPDLLVLGTHGLTTLRRLTLGSTANAVAQLAQCSVLVWS